MAKGCQCDRNAVEGYGPSCSERIAELEAELEATDDALNAARAELAERERALREIADPSYVGNYSPEEVVSIYRKWAAAATHSDSEKT